MWPAWCWSSPSVACRWGREMDSPQDAKERIASANDRVRRQPRPGEIMITRGVQLLGDRALSQTLSDLARFDAFNADNDPYGEHDFGSVRAGDQTVFWKIDYYNLTLTGGSEAPWDERYCRRVLTLMLASEY